MPPRKASQEVAFGDIPKLTDREIQMTLREVDGKVVSRALVGAPQRLKSRIFGNMSKRIGTFIKEEMEFAGSVPPQDVEQAQMRITEALRKLQKAGQITWPNARKAVPKRERGLGKQYLATKRETIALVKRPLHDLSLDEVNRTFYGLAEIARREGILALEGAVRHAGEKFLAAGIRLATDGTEPELIQTILQTWMESLLHEQKVKYRKTLEGIMSIQSGDNPRIVEQKLRVLY